MAEKTDRTTQIDKEEIRKEFIEDMKKDDAPDEVIDLWGVQGGLCYSAFLTGRMVAKRMLSDGDITEDQIVEIAMEWAKLLVMKVSYRPPQSSSDLVIPNLQVLPGGRN